MKAPDLQGLSDAEQERALRDYHHRTYDVLEDVPFWTDGMGITSGYRTRLCLFDTAANDLTYLSEPSVQVDGFTVAEGKVLYVGSTFKTVCEPRSAVYLWDASTGLNNCLLTQGRHFVKLYNIWRNKAVLCITDNGKNDGFCTIDFVTGKLSQLRTGNASVVGMPVRSGKVMANRLSAVWDDTLYFISEERQSCCLQALELPSGEMKTLASWSSMLALDSSAGRVVYLSSDGNGVGELFSLQGEQEIRLTHANDVLCQRYAISHLETLETDAVTGWTMKPANYVAGKKYPAVVILHSGVPLGNTAMLFHEMQVLSASGYFVLYCSPWDVESGDGEAAIVRAYENTMLYLDAALAQYQGIDAQQIGISGSSYGGLLVNWTIGHTGRFKAACSQGSVANWTGVEGTSDTGYYFVREKTGASHREDRARQRDLSPLHYTERVHTPTLFLHGENDYHHWKLEAIEMFMALKFYGTPSRLCIFNGEGHAFPYNGKPRQQMQRLEEILAWYQKYLGKKDA